LFKTLDAPLPGSTKAMLAVGGFMSENWWMVLGGAAAVVSLIVVYVKSEGGRESTHRAMVAIPGLGKVTRAFSMARIARVLGGVVEGRVPLLDALRLTRASVWNRVYAKLIDNAEDAVIRGEPLVHAFTTSLAGVPLVPPSVCEAIRNAEKSGRL